MTFPQFMLMVIACVVNSAQTDPIPQNSNVIWLKAQDWPETHLAEQLDRETDNDQKKFHLLAYLPHHPERGLCKGIMKAILANTKHESIEHIHLFRHNNSCIYDEYLPDSPKISVHALKEGENMTFVNIIKFVAKHCQFKNVILARANMYFTGGINVFTRMGIKDKEVHVLKSEHSNASYQSSDTYYGTHYALIFKGIWDMIDDYPSSTEALSFELDSPKLDNENVLKKIFEETLRMTLVSSDVKAICSHE